MKLWSTWTILWFDYTIYIQTIKQVKQKTALCALKQELDKDKKVKKKEEIIIILLTDVL